MGQITLPGNPPIAVTLRRSAQARRLSLRLSQIDGKVTLTMPRRLPEQEALGFLRDKEGWLRGHLEARGEDVRITPGALVPIEGVLRQVVPGAGRSVVLSDTRVEVPGAPDRVAARLQGWLRTLARERLAEASDRHAAALGRPYARLTLRDTRSRWGSCTHDGGLMYSWRLIMAPPEVLDYVAAHEVAHLAEMNHSAAFWAVVEQLYGDWRAARAWLRDDGGALHRYRFD
ncbi:SprT family zinc-dependent metalloprotease [Salipiger sp. 1_MG-2023]|uniref:M48 family metallopeptidase n=1 Tax=Salipiger sp. 1_MG-2023 TaxID=3062665 RepID=UPI0026E17480|nr:SprT family zinc-dependent metalloprotease [Salipiger sp. 1_MG-2023]MDO6587740.1 SprT family zinc-dependent metalloprotease [Salipiger sp. 1_MG-2023]